MRGKDLLECMEYIDDALVQEALEPAVDRHISINRYMDSPVSRWSIAAACVVVIGISALTFWLHQNTGNGQIEIKGDDSPMAMDTAGGEDNSSVSSVTAGTAAEIAQESVDVAAVERSSEMGSDEEIPDSLDSCALQKADEYSVLENADVNDMGMELREMAEEEAAKHGYSIISDYCVEEDGSAGDYPIPEKGKYFCYYYLQKTMEYYAEMENADSAVENPVYAYEVVIDLYGDVEIEDCRDTCYEQLNVLENTNAGNEMIEQEYRRLEELGYAVRLSEDFQLTGIFTKAEIDTFQASPEYGYTFRFASEP